MNHQPLAASAAHMGPVMGEKPTRRLGRHYKALFRQQLVAMQEGK